MLFLLNDMKAFDICFTCFNTDSSAPVEAVMFRSIELHQAQRRIHPGKKSGQNQHGRWRDRHDGGRTWCVDHSRLLLETCPRLRVDDNTAVLSFRSYARSTVYTSSALLTVSGVELKLYMVNSVLYRTYSFNMTYRSVDRFCTRNSSKW